MTSPAQAARDREKARVSRLTDIAQRCHGDRWLIDAESGKTNIIAQRANGEADVLCTIYPGASPEEIELITGALENTVLFLELRDRAIMALKQGHPAQPQRGAPRYQLRDGDFAANAAILCAEPLFHRFLERRNRDGGAIHDNEQADRVLKKLLGITSKSQLNREERAQMAFINLRGDFEIWKGGRA